MNRQTRRPVSYELQKAITQGKILSFEKVKSLPIGKVHITAGKYQTAVPVPGKQYAVIFDGKHCKDAEFFWSRVDLVRYLIDFCGRDVLWVALGGSRFGNSIWRDGRWTK